MKHPQIEGLKVTDLAGSGSAGRVYAAHDETNARFAVKVFHSSSINRHLLRRAISRLEAADWPEGAMPIVSADLDSHPALWVMPWKFQRLPNGQDRGASLQHRLDAYPGDSSWPTVVALARVLGTFHDLRIAHGNLKPSNIFFDDQERVLLSDWALGNMPDVTPGGFTDAYLYQPPEQLIDPHGYLEEKGYRWDVFSFGVIAFRLLTGAFPRCHETFIEVAPTAGNLTLDPSLKVDVGKLAKRLMTQPEVAWPEEPGSDLEAAYRKWITRCLALDPANRPATMSEVVWGLESAREKFANAKGPAAAASVSRVGGGWWGSIVAFGTLATLALIMGGLWQLSRSVLKKEKTARKEEVAGLREALANSNRERDAALESATKARQVLEYEKALSLARLQASRAIGDHLFEWAMEKGHRRLPPLDGRELRLRRLDRYFDEFLTQSTARPELEDERARAKLAMAEIALAMGDAALAKARLEEALLGWPDRPKDAAWQMRIATNRLLLALVSQSKNARNDPETSRSFQEARRALSGIRRAEVDVDRLDQLVAVLDFHEAQVLADQGRNGEALEQLMRATQTLNRLVDQRPDATVLRSELANCYLSSSTILEGMGSMGDAREVRHLAAAQLVKLLQQKPNDPELRLNLAGCYGGMAEAAMLSGDIASAESLSQQAVDLLEGLLRERPDHLEALSRLGAQRWIRASLLTDRGLNEEALQLIDDGIRLLEPAAVSNPKNGSLHFRLALLWWQKGRILATQGPSKEEVELIENARETLVTLQTRSEYGIERGDQLKKTIGYILGDLGLARQLMGDLDGARSAFAEAVKVWEGLSKTFPNNEEAEEALAWCRARFKEVPNTSITH